MVVNEDLRKCDLYLMGMTKERRKKMDCEWLDESKMVDWEDEEEACAWMMMLVPNLEEWAAAIIWQVLDYAKSDPEGLDIEQLHASVLSILNEATNIHMVAAGERGNLASLEDWELIQLMENMATEARKESRPVIEKEQEKGEVAINYMVAAGAVGQNKSPLVVNEMEKMVDEARTDSRLEIEKERAQKREQEQEQGKAGVTINYMVAAGAVGQNL